MRYFYPCLKIYYIMAIKPLKVISMKEYFKRFIILKRLNGRENCTLKIESNEGVFNVYGELFTNSFAPKKYTLYYCDYSGNVKFLSVAHPRFNVELSGDITRGFTAMLFDKHTPILYGCYGESLTVEKMTLSVERAKNLVESYDDEVIATENYYEVENGKESVYNTADGRGCQNENSTQEETAESRTSLHENTDCRERKNYYLTVKDKLDQLIQTYEYDYTLSSLIPKSQFVKINYDKDKFYSIGTVLQNQEVKFICYAVLGTYQNSPKELKDYCEFLPLSPFNALGEGYYVIFQSATNGEIVKSFN